MSAYQNRFGGSISVVEKIGVASLEYTYYPNNNIWTKREKVGSAENYTEIRKEDVPKRIVKFLSFYGSEEGV